MWWCYECCKEVQHMAVWVPQMSCTLANILTLQCLGRSFKCNENQQIQSDPVEIFPRSTSKSSPHQYCHPSNVELFLIWRSSSPKYNLKRSSVTLSLSQWVMMVIRLILVIQMIHRSFWSTSPFWCFHHHQKSIISFISPVHFCQISNLLL